jgi:hypothetical protein
LPRRRRRLRKLTASVQVRFKELADTDPMNEPALLTYNLGYARDLDRERPTLADLQRAQAHAIRDGDRRRAAAYAVVIRRRIDLAQQRAWSVAA